MLFLAFLSSLSLQLLVSAETDQLIHARGGTIITIIRLCLSVVARDNCELYGSHLLQIDNMAENYCLLDYAQSQGMTVQYWYHSGNDIEREGVYRQADGEPILWTPLWASPNPDHGTGGNCLMVRLVGDANAGKWWDDPCNSPRQYICERS